MRVILHNTLCNNTYLITPYNSENRSGTRRNEIKRTQAQIDETQKEKGKKNSMLSLEC